MTGRLRSGAVAGPSETRTRRALRALAAACLFWLGAASPCASAGEIELRAAIRAEAAHLLERGDIGTFEQRATELRRTRARTPAGIWELALFYKGVDDLPARNPGAAAWRRAEDATSAYLKAHPDSPSAVIAAARVLVAHAWAYRGDGLGSQLSSTQQNGFAEELERGRAILDAHREAAAHDPDWYALRIQVMNGQGIAKASIMALAKEALGGEPTYESTYYVASTAFLPKWGGSAELLQQYLATVIERTSEQEGRQAYARIAFNIARNDPEPIEALRKVGIGWAEVKESLEEIAAAHPDPWNENAERAMACLIGSETDFNATSREGHPMIPVAWFDRATRWQDCSLRQQRAAPVSIKTALRSTLSASPSPYLLTTACAAILLPLAALYLSRRFRTAAGGADAGREAEALRQNVVAPGQVYRATKFWMLGQAALGSVLVLAGAAGAWGFGAVADVHDTPVGLVLAFLSASFASMGVLVAVDAFVSRIVLQGTVMEIIELWRTRRIRRDDVATRQTVRRPNSPAQLVLKFKDPARRAVKLLLVFPLDTQFDAWVSPIPDVDALAAAALEAEIRNAPQLGNTPQERLARFAQARKFARYAAFVGPALYVWSSVYPHPYVLIIGLLALLPWICVGLMAMHPGVYQLNGTAGSGRPDLAGVLLPLGVILALRAYIDVRTLDWESLLPWAFAAGALLAASISWASRGGGRKLGTSIVILLVSLAYGYGTVTSANAVLDSSAPSTYRPAVLRKHVSGGRYRSYELLVGAWGDRKYAEDITVPAEVYREALVGQVVCVSMHEGALGSHWYGVSACNASTGH